MVKVPLFHKNKDFQKKQEKDLYSGFVKDFILEGSSIDSKASVEVAARQHVGQKKVYLSISILAQKKNKQSGRGYILKEPA